MQKAADQVRVNVQLINAQTDSHLWADTYDRKLTDIFGVESEIAKRIAESLQAKLTGREEQALAVKPTNNPEAYEAYLRGLAFEASVGYRLIRYRRSSIFMSERCSLTRILRWLGDGFLVRTRIVTSSANIGQSERLRHRAVPPPLAAMQQEKPWRMRRNSEPNSPKTLLALGYYQFWVLRDFGLAKSTFRQRTAKCYPAAARPHVPSAQLANVKDTGMKALPTWNKPSSWIHVTWIYWEIRHRLTRCFDNSRQR